MNEEKLYEVLNNQIQFSNDLMDLNIKYAEEIERLNNIIHLIKNNIDITIQIIKEQPTGNDEWVLERLNGIKNIGELKGSDKE